MKLSEFLQHDRFARQAGAELLTIEPGYAKARMEITPDHLNAAGVCQGGALFTLADLSFAAVANSYGQVTLSLTAHITFLKAVSEGWLYAEAREVYHHSRIPYIEVRISQEDGTPVAIMTSSGYRKKDTLPVAPLTDTTGQP